jgi:hypothetical protein
MKKPVLLNRKDIDEQKWNALIHSSVQSLPYALTWYLDAVAPNWSALVLGNYEAVFPLPWLRRLGVKCIYQPYYCQQLGVFSKTTPDSHLLRLFLDALQQFAYVNINLNPTTQAIADAHSLKSKKNLLLSLHTDYNTLRKAYSENHRRNIAKAEKNGLQFLQDIGQKQFQDFYLKNIDRQKENFKQQHEKVFKALCKAAVANNSARIFAAALPDGTISTAVMLLLHGNRAINIINVSSAEGKKNGSAHFLFNRLIGTLAATSPGTLLDFEGSSIPGIARFYEGFGAQPEVFYNYQTSLLKKLSQRFS